MANVKAIKVGGKITTLREKKQAKGKTNKRAKSSIKAQKKPIKKNLHKGLSKGGDTLKTRKVSKKGDSLKKVMLKSLEKDTLKEERDMTPREEKRIKKVGKAISLVEKTYTKSRETTGTAIEFSGNVVKGTFSLVTAFVGESFHLLGWGILGIVAVTGKGYRGISKISPLEKKTKNK